MEKNKTIGRTQQIQEYSISIFLAQGFVSFLNNTLVKAIIFYCVISNFKNSLTIRCSLTYCCFVMIRQIRDKLPTDLLTER
jgi:hypothetical protein